MHAPFHHAERGLQKIRDATVTADTKSAIDLFMRNRVPGVRYEVSSVVGERGELIITLAPRERL